MKIFFLHCRYDIHYIYKPYTSLFIIHLYAMFSFCVYPDATYISLCNYPLYLFFPAITRTSFVVL